MKLAIGTLLSLSLFAMELGAVEVSRHRESASGAEGWRLLDEQIRVELNPLYRDQVRAFYLGRGFSEVIAERISRECVYQAVVENVSSEHVPVSLEVRLAEWGVASAGGGNFQCLVAKPERIKTLARAGASEAALLAFKWATFPEQQDFKLSGDYGWGMILFGEQQGARFDLRVRWYANGEVRQHTIRGLTCLGDAPEE